MSDTPTMDDLARLYIKMRDKISAIEAEAETKVKEIKAQQAEVSTAMKDMMLAEKANSVRTPSGTVTLLTKTRFQAQDWDSFYNFIVEHNAPHLLEKRISQGAMANFLEANPEKRPVGLVSDTEYQISVRRPSTKE